MAQALVLVAMYQMSRRFFEQFDRFMKDTREMMVPLKTITENLRAASANIVEIGLSAREQCRRVEGMVTDTGQVLHTQLERIDIATRDVVERINATAHTVQDSVLMPFREAAAMAKGLGRGIEAFFFRKRKSTVDQAHQDEELFI